MIIFILLNPLTLNTSSSFLLISSRKNNKDEIKKIKGKISNNMDGALIIVNIKGYRVFAFTPLKYEISSKTFKIIINDKNIKETLIIFFKKVLIKYFW